MIFYRRPRQVYAISFDLDDTLYDNVPVILAAEQGLHDYLAERLPALNGCDWDTWQRHWHRERRRQVLLQPELADDVTALRKRAIYQMAIEHGASRAESLRMSSDGFAHFLELRNQVKVPDESLALLAALAENLPLVAITNGNVDLNAIGLAEYFQFSLAAGAGWRMKPAPDLFIEAERRLAQPIEHLLHVGDNLRADVGGACLRGWQSAWYNPERRCLRQTRKMTKSPLSLPTFELHDLASLRQLI